MLIEFFSFFVFGVSQFFIGSQNPFGILLRTNGGHVFFGALVFFSFYSRIILHGLINCEIVIQEVVENLYILHIIFYPNGFQVNGTYCVITVGVKLRNFIGVPIRGIHFVGVFAGIGILLIAQYLPTHEAIAFSGWLIRFYQFLPLHYSKDLLIPFVFTLFRVGDFFLVRDIAFLKGFRGGGNILLLNGI
ncbi:Uncharacterised protein [Chlamydia trachomatis]|nr:Uncharacterised protein [Chlamydia trachomatis]